MIREPEVDGDLPEISGLLGSEDDWEEAYQIYAVLKAIDWRWTPLDVRSQPELLLHNVLILGGLSNKVKRIADDAHHGKI